MPTSRAPHFFGLLGLALFATCTWSRPLFDHLNIKDPTFRTCGELSAPVRVHEVDLSPKLPYPGATLDINLHAISQGRTLEPMKVIRYSSYTPSSLYPPHEAPFPVPLPLPPSLPRRPPPDTESYAGGSIQLDVKVQGIPVWREVDDLCTRTACPVAAGDVLVFAHQELPPAVPLGSYSAHLVASDTHGREIMCVEVFFDIGPAPSPPPSPSIPHIGSSTHPAYPRHQLTGVDAW